MGWLLLFAGLGLLAYAFLRHTLQKRNALMLPELNPYDYKAASYENQAHPNQGIAANVLTRISVNSATKTQQAVNAAVAQVVEGADIRTTLNASVLAQKAAAERFEETREKEKADHAVYILKQYNEKLRLVLQQKLLDVCIATGEDYEIYQKRQLNELEVKQIEAQAEAKIRAGFFYKLAPYHELKQISSDLIELYKLEYSVQNGNGPKSVTAKELAEIRKNITAVRRDADVRRKRLVPAGDRKEIGGSDEDSEY